MLRYLILLYHSYLKIKIDPLDLFHSESFFQEQWTFVHWFQILKTTIEKSYIVYNLFGRVLPPFFFFFFVPHSILFWPFVLYINGETLHASLAVNINISPRALPYVTKKILKHIRPRRSTTACRTYTERSRCILYIIVSEQESFCIM